jgi:hypothetical protein
VIKSDKIREYFRTHPEAEVTKVAAKFKASRPMAYKLRKQVQNEWQPPEMVPVPDPNTNGKPARKVTLTRSQMEMAKMMGVSLKSYVQEGLTLGVLKYDDEQAQQEADVDETLNTRAQDYGKFKDGAALMQGIKRLLADHARAHDKLFADDQWEALEMIVHKIGRIVNGNPDKVDSWVDIAGYATLVADRLQGNAR